MSEFLDKLSGQKTPHPPVKLFEKDDHSVWWVGIIEETAFRSNVYMVKNGDKAVLIDPGHRAFFDSVKNAVSQVLDPKNVCGLILCHQDPDVCASMTDWLEFTHDINIISTPRTHVLLPYYGRGDYARVDAGDSEEYRLGNSVLKFIESPFMHFPGAFTTYDPISGFLFSGDIWAAIDTDWKLVSDDFDGHISGLDLFHKDYIASNVACRGFVEKLEGVAINAILPQHGSIISKNDVKSAISYLKNLNCGLDIIYPHISL